MNKVENIVVTKPVIRYHGGKWRLIGYSLNIKQREAIAGDLYRQAEQHRSSVN